MDTKSTRKHIIVTGTSKGLGKEIASGLIKSGYQVTGCSRSALKEDIFPTAAYQHLVADLTEPSSVEVIISEIVRTKTSCLILNAAEYFPFDPKDTTAFEKQMKVNLIFTMQLLNRLNATELPDQLKIINISSVMAFIPDEINPLYSASKAAVAHYLSGLQWKQQGALSYLNVYVGPLQEQKNGLLQTLAFATYHEAAAQVIEHIFTERTSLYIPGVWKWVHRFFPLTPSWMKRKLISNNRRLKAV